MAQRLLFLAIAVFLGVFLLFAQTPYYGPNNPAQPGAVQVQLLVYDQPELGGLRIETVSFNGKTIGLQPPDLYGFRGGGGFQLRPGSYRLDWKVSRDKSEWPRSLSHHETIEIKSRDSWVQVTIRGDNVTIL